MSETETVQVKPAMGQTWKCKAGCAHVLAKQDADGKWIDSRGNVIEMQCLTESRLIEFVSHPEPRVKQTWKYNDKISSAHNGEYRNIVGSERVIKHLPRNGGDMVTCYISRDSNDETGVPIAWFRAGYLDLIEDVAAPAPQKRPQPAAKQSVQRICEDCRQESPTIAMRMVRGFSTRSISRDMCDTCMMKQEGKIARETYKQDRPATPTVIVKEARYDVHALQAPWESMRGALVCPVRGRRPNF